MNSNGRDQSSREYQRQAEATWHRLAEHLDELNERLTPGQVFDEVLTYSRGGSGTLMRAFTNAARESPVPTLLIGAGCLLFLSEKFNLNRYVGRGAAAAEPSDSPSMISRASDRLRGAAGRASDAASSSADALAGSVRSSARSAADFASEQASSMAAGARSRAEAMSDTLSGTAQSVRDTAGDIREQAAGAADSMRRGAQQLAGTAQDYSAAVGEQMSEAAAQSREQMTRAARQAKKQATSFINEQPLLCAALGLALGAALAAALPSTEAEDELLGEKSDAVKQKLGEVASEQLETAKAAAGNIAQQAMSAAAREGLSPGSAAEAVRGIGEKVKRVVNETASAGASQVRESLNKGS